MTNVAIMQPYIFPYIGYFRLMACTDIFVCLDDVNFIKKGWIHRNRLLFNGGITYFSIPLKKASQNTFIKDLEVSTENYQHWRDKFFKSLAMYYKKAPYYSIGLALTEKVFLPNSTMLAELAYQSLVETCELLKITPRIIPSSVPFKKEHLAGEERIIAMCKELNATDYSNLPGGVALYTPECFGKNNINLHFVGMDLERFKLKTSQAIAEKPLQNNGFLSILDTIMHLGVDLTRECILDEKI